MVKDETYARVREIISKALYIDIQKVQYNSKLENLGADSLDVLEITLALEEKFNCDILEDWGFRKTKVKDIIAAIKKSK